jgi:hypothetical protein
MSSLLSGILSVAEDGGLLRGWANAAGFPAARERCTLFFLNPILKI